MRILSGGKRSHELFCITEGFQTPVCFSRNCWMASLGHRGELNIWLSYSKASLEWGGSVGSRRLKCIFSALQNQLPSCFYSSFSTKCFDFFFLSVAERRLSLKLGVKRRKCQALSKVFSLSLQLVTHWVKTIQAKCNISEELSLFF